MNDFAELLDRLAYEPSRNNKLRLIADYLRTTFFKPLGLKDTGTFVNATPPPGVAPATGTSRLPRSVAMRSSRERCSARSSSRWVWR